MNDATNKATETVTSFWCEATGGGVIPCSKEATEMVRTAKHNHAAWSLCADHAKQARGTMAAHDADAAYSAELRRVFGKLAGDARYDARGTSTPELRRLADAKVAADNARR